MTFTPDFPNAIVVEAAQYGYGGKPGAVNKPRAWVLHTPEEPTDNNPSTPYYFHDTTNDASTTYFVAYAEKPGPLGPTRIFQCVPEKAGAYGNAVEGKPYPTWADATVNLNLQTLSIEIEGFASNIHQTMPRGSGQWKALVELMAHRCKALGFPVERTIGHYQVSTNRSDPGQLAISAIIEDVNALLTPAPQEDADMFIARLKDPPFGFWIVGPGGRRAPVHGQAEIDAYIRGGVAVHDWTQADVDAVPPAAAGDGPTHGTWEAT